MTTNITLGYTAFFVDDVRATLDFYIVAFGLAEKLMMDDYGELDTGATTLAFVAHSLAEENLAAAGGYARRSADSPPLGGSVTLVTDDVAASLQKAVDAGGRRYVDPVDKPWGWTMAYLLDPNGLLVELASPTAK